MARSQDSIAHVLEAKGPLASSDLKSILTASGLTEEAARKRISRSKEGVRRLKTIQLPKREQFLYLDNQYGKIQFWESLIKAHSEKKSAYGTALQSIIARGGAIPKIYFDIVSGAPLKLKKHISSDIILTNLIACKLLKIEMVEEIGECIFVDAQGTLDQPKPNELKARLTVEDIIVIAVLDWCRKLGIASHDAIKSRNLTEVPKFGQFGWDITAPSYIYPLSTVNSKGLLPGFIAVDVINSVVDVPGINYFINKFSINRSIRKMRPFLAMLIADRFTPEAYNLGRKSGAIVTTPEIIFGAEVAEGLKSLSKTLENAAAVAAKNPDKIYDLFNSLSKIEGAAINLRGALFELIVGHLVLNGEGGSIDIGIKVNDSKGNSAEIDVRRVKGTHETTTYECKGHQPSTQTTDKEIETWLTKRIPIIRDAYLLESRLKNTDMIFEYWTSGEFTDPALSKLENAKKKTTKYRINWKNGSEILKYAKEIKSTSMVRTLSQHYLKHPLSEGG